MTPRFRIGLLATLLLIGGGSAALAQQSGLSGNIKGNVSGNTRSRLDGNLPPQNVSPNRAPDPAAQNNIYPLGQRWLGPDGSPQSVPPNSRTVR